MFDNAKIFQPVLPKLSVSLIATEDDLHEAVDHMRFMPEYATRRDNKKLSESSIRGMRVRKSRAYIQHFDSGFDPDATVLAIGDYFVKSENGYYFITSSVVVKHGAFADFPAELFIPIEGVASSL